MLVAETGRGGIQSAVIVFLGACGQRNESCHVDLNSDHDCHVGCPFTLLGNLIITLRNVAPVFIAIHVAHQSVVLYSDHDVFGIPTDRQVEGVAIMVFPFFSAELIGLECCIQKTCASL